MDREERNCVKVGIDIGGRGIIPRLSELLEVANQEWRAIKLQESTSSTHHIEEPADVSNTFVRLRRCLAREFGEES